MRERRTAATHFQVGLHPTTAPTTTTAPTSTTTSATTSTTRLHRLLYLHLQLQLHLASAPTTDAHPRPSRSRHTVTRPDATASDSGHVVGDDDGSMKPAWRCWQNTHAPLSRPFSTSLPRRDIRSIAELPPRLLPKFHGMPGDPNTSPMAASTRR